MSNDLQIFQNSEFGKIRAIEIDGNPWFVGKDAAVALSHANPERAIRNHVNQRDKMVTDLVTISGIKPHIIINESGLYSLIFSSRTEIAKEFTRWVTSEVLPAIRKHGVYATENFVEKTLNDPDYAIRVFTELKNERIRRQEAEAKVEVQAQQIEELAPKANYCDVILSTTNAIPISVIAKDYGKSAVWLNEILRRHKIQHLVGGTWVLNAPYANEGYTETATYQYGNGKSRVHTYWTQKGRKFIYELLESLRYFPLTGKFENE